MDTIAAISTGAQVSAIGIVRLSGDRAIEIVSKAFRSSSGKRPDTFADRKLVYGEISDPEGRLLDAGLCTVSRGPASYTGEDTAELQCHGSPVVLREILRTLFHYGARQALPGEFSKRAFLNGKMDLTSAEAVIDLIDAESAEAARNAAGQLSGAIFRKTDRIYNELKDISAHYHAVLDYPDEDIEEFRLEAYRSTVRSALDGLQRLLSTIERGRILKNGIPTAIVGKPNAGKSSLMNALLGYDRAIVTDVPGTTRDTIEEKVQLGRNMLRLIDTAGLRETEDTVEKLGVERSREALRSAGLVLAVFDSSVDCAEEDRALLRSIPDTSRTVAVITKNDLSGDRAEAFKKALLKNGAPSIGKSSPAVPAVSVSSLTGDGIAELEAVIDRLFPVPQVPAGEILTNSRQEEAVRRAADYLNAALEAMTAGMTPDIVLTETEGAMTAIGELTGRTIREDITNRIFERFCVGK